MLFSFFRGSPAHGSLDHVVTKAISMLVDARHSFDLATMALLTNADAADVAQDVRDTDRRINITEQELRSELVVHVTVQGGSDIGSVLGFTLLLKKIERIGDQAKNILDLAEQGVSLADHPDIDEMLAARQTLSELFVEVTELLADPDTSAEVRDEFGQRVDALVDQYQAKIDSCMRSELPGREVVPLAIYYRYLRRIAANLLGIVLTADTPIHPADDLANDIDD
jgi:phosphate uptake regulator